MARAFNGTLGQPPLPLRELYVPAVLEILIIAACGLRSQKVVSADMRENTISALLDKQMRAARNGGNASDIISWFMRPLIPRDPDHPLEMGEPDFMFTWGTYPSCGDPCLQVEAKRLRGTGQSLAGEYVDQGVMRFVQGDYGRGHDYGIMMAYVMVPPIANAISRVSASMNQREDPTRQLSTFTPNDSMCPYPDVHHSAHVQDGAKEPITLVHIFFDFS